VLVVLVRSDEVRTSTTSTVPDRLARMVSWLGFVAEFLRFFSGRVKDVGDIRP